MSTEVKRNYLEIKNLEDLLEGQKPLNDCTVKIIEPINFKINKFFYKQIGKKYNWVDRLSWSNNQWVKYVNDSKVKTFILKEDDDLVGYYEQIFSEDKSECEIAYFGILKEYFGNKFGGYLLSDAIKKSFDYGAKRVWVHTCSLDHKHALKNYLSRGMKVFKSEVININ